MKNYEIERKWLLDPDHIPFDLSSAARTEKIEQAYISFRPTIRIRSVNGSKFILTVKSGSIKGQLARQEYELELTGAEFDELMKKCEGSVIRKTRYCFPAENGLTVELDVFEGEFTGLVYMEIEFPDEESAKAYPTPSFAMKDVSDDKNYTNAALAKQGKK